MTILYMIAGAALFMGGFFVAWKLKPPNVVERHTEPIQEPLAGETMKNIQEQYANWMSFDGRKQT